MYTSSSGFQFLELPETLEPFEKRILDLLTSPKIIAKSNNELAMHPWQSKIGGMPYVPIGVINPLLCSPEEGISGDLVMLFQLNLEELEPIKGFPNKGILQFFVLSDDPYEEDSKLVYYKNIETTLDKIQTDFSDFTEEFGTETNNTPIQGIAINLEYHDFSLLEGYEDHNKIQGLFADVKNEIDRDSLIYDFCKYLDDLNTSYEDCLDQAEDQDGSNCRIQIGGNVFQFWNGDPRELNEGSTTYDRLIMEYIPADSKDDGFNTPLKGHDIRCQFFIGSKDLKDSNFENYLYHGMT